MRLKLEDRNVKQYEAPEQARCYDVAVEVGPSEGCGGADGHDRVLAPIRT